MTNYNSSTEDECELENVRTQIANESAKGYQQGFDDALHDHLDAEIMCSESDFADGYRQGAEEYESRYSGSN